MRKPNISLNYPPAYSQGEVLIGFATPEGLLPESTFTLIGNHKDTMPRREALWQAVVERGFLGELGEVIVLQYDELRKLNLVQNLYPGNSFMVVGYGDKAIVHDSLVKVGKSIMGALSAEVAMGHVKPPSSRTNLLISSIILEHRITGVSALLGRGVIDKLIGMRSTCAQTALAEGLTLEAASLLKTRKPEPHYEFWFHGIGTQSGRMLLLEHIAPRAIEVAFAGADA